MDPGREEGRAREMSAPDTRALSDVELDDLPEELLALVQTGLDEQSRLRLLVDAVVAMTSDLTLDGVLTRIVSFA